MKITDPEVIRNGEKDLIESVQEDLDIDAVREILKERMSVAALASKGGQIVVHNNEIAFRLDFEINLSGSLLFDREGNFLEGSENQTTEDLDQALEDLDDEEGFGPDSQDLEEEDLSIALPDYDLEDEYEDELSDTPDPAPDMVQAPEEDLEAGLDIDEELDLAAEELALESLEDEENLDDEPKLDGALDLEEKEEDPDFAQDLDDEENPFGDEDMDAQDLDDDINDILKESREFWEQKKD